MKMFKKIAVCLAVLVLFICNLSLTVFATSNSQDGLETTITTNKESYSSNDDIQLTITIENTNSFAVDNVALEGILPCGLKLKSGELNSQRVSLGSGETIIVSAIAFLENPGEVNSTVTENSSNSTSQESKPINPNTGDNANIFHWVIFFIISAVVLILTIKFKKKKNKILSLILCSLLLVNSVPFSTLANASEVQKSSEISHTISVDENEYTIKAVTSYMLKTSGNDPTPSNDTFTRGQWITLLTNKLGISKIQIGEDYDYFYGDSQDSEYGEIVETAKALGLLPAPDSIGYEDPKQDIPLFEADKLATREFVAYTVAKGMGFEGEYSIDCNDLNKIKYISEIAVVVQQKFLTLIDGNFLPHEKLIGTDKNRIFDRIDYFNDSLVIDASDSKDEISLQDNVVQLTDVDYTIVENEDGTFVVTLLKDSNTNRIIENTVFVLPPNDRFISGISLKATNVNVQDENIIITCVAPDIEEVVNDFDFAGVGTADISHMTVADGVTAEYDPNGTILVDNDEQLAPFNIDGGFKVPGRIKCNLNKKIGNTGITVSGGFEFELPKIIAKAKGKILGSLAMDELTVAVTSEFKVNANIKYDFGIPDSGFDVTTGNRTFGSGKTELWRVPIALGATGLSLDFVLFVNFDVSGKATISYSITNTTGFQYKDNAFRIIKDYETKFNTVELNATARLGLGLAVRISLFSVFDLGGIDAHAGIGVTAKFTARTDVDPNLYCGDGTVYFYATLELDDDTLIIDILKNHFGFSWSWDIYDENSERNPLKLNLHFENGKQVPECTYGKGHIQGLVKDAETGEPIGGARIKIYNNATNILVKTVQTQEISLLLSGLQLYKGEFLAGNLPVGNYRLEITATGYQSYNINIDVVKGQRVVCEAALMVLRDNISGNGTVKGLITNALTGELLKDVNYIVRKGWNALDGEVITQGTTSSTAYSIELASGNYTIEFKKGGFITVVANVVVQSGIEVEKNIAITPNSDININDDSFRVVLTWGEYPRDLDSHLYGYDSNNNQIFHTWYQNKNYYENRDMIANLDLDDTDSYGPETSTVYKMSAGGKYSFYVHDFINRSSSSSTALSNSEAQVKLYSGGNLVATFNIPQNRDGTLWHVFDYDSATDEFSFINEISYSYYG